MTADFRAGFAVLAAMVLVFGGPVVSQGSAPPAGPVVLTVTGLNGQSDAAGTLLFDLDMLQAMDSRSFTTETIWTNGPQEFVGVGLDTLLENLGVTDGTLTAFAINDYFVEIPLSDAVPDGPIIAYSVNGAEMSVREKGPLWIVYPYDENSDYQSEQIYTRNIWQLDRLEVGE